MCLLIMFFGGFPPCSDPFYSLMSVFFLVVFLNVVLDKFKKKFSASTFELQIMTLQLYLDFKKHPSIFGNGCRKPPQMSKRSLQ